MFTTLPNTIRKPSYTLSEALWTWLSVGGANTFRLTYKSRVMTKNWFQPYFTIVSFNWRPILYTKGFRLWMVLLFLWFLVQDFLLLNRLKRAQFSVLPVFWRIWGSPRAGISINFKTWVFYKRWFPRFGFFISRPYAVFYIKKVVFFIKECTFYSFQLFFKPKQWFCHFWSLWQLVVRCHFGFWPLGRVGFEATFNLIRPVLSFL